MKSTMIQDQYDLASEIGRANAVLRSILQRGLDPENQDSAAEWVARFRAWQDDDRPELARLNAILAEQEAPAEAELDSYKRASEDIRAMGGEA